MFGRVATALNGQFIHFKSVLLVCACSTQGRSQRRPLLVSNTECFSKVFASHSMSLSVHIFRFYARDGVVYWNGWGQPEEEKWYSTRWQLLDPEYSPLF
jgi:hypothetical protein